MNNDGQCALQEKWGGHCSALRLNFFSPHFFLCLSLSLSLCLLFKKLGSEKTATLVPLPRRMSRCFLAHVCVCAFPSKCQTVLCTLFHGTLSTDPPSTLPPKEARAPEIMMHLILRNACWRKTRPTPDSAAGNKYSRYGPGGHQKPSQPTVTEKPQILL